MIKAYIDPSSQVYYASFYIQGLYALLLMSLASSAKSITYFVITPSFINTKAK